MPPPLRLAIAGLGGFAAFHHRTVAALESAGHCRLVATCDPRARTLATECAEFAFSRRGVRVFTAYEEMLETHASELDYIVLSTPIPLHAPMHARAVAAGVPVYLEKPPTLDPAELDSMIATDAHARYATHVAFHYTPELARLALKQRLLSGEFGAIRGTALVGFSPRPPTYFQRAPWAGRLLIDGRLTLDSCLGNALAHSAHNLLFWSAAEALHAWDSPESVRASLHRTHAIEGADTFFVEARLRSGIVARLAVTHAGEGPPHHEEIVECERATLRCIPNKLIEILWREDHVGHVELIDCTAYDGIRENHLAFHRFLRREAARPPTTLKDSHPFVALHALAHLAAERIAPLPTPLTLLPKALMAFAGDGVWPCAAASRAATPADLPGLASHVATLCHTG